VPSLYANPDTNNYTRIISSIISLNTPYAGIKGSINACPYDKVVVYSPHPPHQDIVDSRGNDVVTVVPGSRRYIAQTRSAHRRKWLYAHSASIDVALGHRCTRVQVLWDPAYLSMPKTRITLSIAASSLTPEKSLFVIGSIIPLQRARVGFVERKIDIAGIPVDDVIRQVQLKNGRELRAYTKTTTTYYCGSRRSDCSIICYDTGARQGLAPGLYTRLEARQRLRPGERPAVAEFARGSWIPRYRAFNNVMIADAQVFQRLHWKTRKAFTRKGLHQGLRDYQNEHGARDTIRLKRRLLKPFAELMDAWDDLLADWSALDDPIADPINQGDKIIDVQTTSAV